MEQEVFNQLSLLAHEHQVWRSPPMMVESFPSITARESRVIDLVSTLEHKQQTNRWQSWEQIFCGCHWFPSDLTTNSSKCRHKILQMLSKPCSVAGFSLIAGKTIQTPNKNGLIPLRLVCNRAHGQWWYFRKWCGSDGESTP